VRSTRTKSIDSINESNKIGNWLINLEGDLTEQRETLKVMPGSSLVGEVGTQGRLSLPGDKSISHRAALFAALAEGQSEINNFLVSGVTSAMLNALTKIGVEWEIVGELLRIDGKGIYNSTREASKSRESLQINCGNSATTLRLLAGGLAAMGIPVILDGTAGLRRRPMDRIVKPLQQMGVGIEATDGCAPLHLKQSTMPLQPIDYMPRTASAQVKSCILLAALGANGKTTIREPGPSRDHTERMLRSMGIEVISRTDLLTDCRDGNRSMDYITEVNVTTPVSLRPLKMKIPGDFSAAAFLIVAGLICPGSNVTIRRVGLNPTRTGLLDALERMGADLRIDNILEQSDEPIGDIHIQSSNLRGIEVNGSLVVRMIDEFPIFAVAASYAKGRTVVSEARELRYKESDRISSLCRELKIIGGTVSENPDGFIIDGREKLEGGKIEPHGDHRLAMALTVAGLNAQRPVNVVDPGIIAESFPGFYKIMEGLGANLRVEYKDTDNEA
jgi:3-phosphoshikimate 1-carboxyvinyltransferase